MTRTIRAAAVALSLAAATGACADSALPTAAADAALMQSTPAAKPAGATIAGTALAINEQTGEFSTLIAAILAADPAVLATLDGAGQYTVFAPTDAAFAKLGLTAENIAGELDQGTLTYILLYHVTEGRRQSQSIVNVRQVSMLNGLAAPVTRTPLRIGGAVIDLGQINVSASNGIIHVLEDVMLPPQ